MFVHIVHKAADVEGKTPEQAFLLMSYDRENDTHLILGHDTEKEARAYWEESYNRKHVQSYEGSMSACIHYIMFSPRIHEMPDVAEEKLKELIYLDEGGEPHLLSLSCVAGYMKVLKGNDVTLKAWEEGINPDLINEGFNDESVKKDARQVFSQYGHEEFAEIVKEALGLETPSNSELEKYFASLPPQIQGIARDWGTSDTVFRDQALVHLRKNGE
jgi:hypothetical protein